MKKSFLILLATLSCSNGVRDWEFVDNQRSSKKGITIYIHTFNNERNCMQRSKNGEKPILQKKNTNKITKPKKQKRHNSPNVIDLQQPEKNDQDTVFFNKHAFPTSYGDSPNLSIDNNLKLPSIQEFDAQIEKMLKEQQSKP